MNSHTDPSGYWGGVVTVVTAFLALLTAFGLPLTDDQQKAILTFVAVAAPFIAQLLIRRHAWAPASVVQRLADQAQAADPRTAVPSDVVDRVIGRDPGGA